MQRHTLGIDAPVVRLLLSHFYLRSLGTKILPVLAVVPLAIAKNAIRIFALSMLGMHVDSGFLYGNLHRNGGIVFFVLALLGMVCLASGFCRGPRGRRIG